MTAEPIAGNPSRYAEGWRDGFHAGGVSALRCAERRFEDPEVWAILGEVAQDYQPDAGE